MTSPSGRLLRAAEAHANPSKFQIQLIRMTAAAASNKRTSASAAFLLRFFGMQGAGQLL